MIAAASLVRDGVAKIHLLPVLRAFSCKKLGAAPRQGRGSSELCAFRGKVKSLQWLQLSLAEGLEQGNLFCDYMQRQAQKFPIAITQEKEKPSSEKRV